MKQDDEWYYTVGEIAQKSGVTIRTLQFYDKSGLLSPSQYTQGGRRLYGWRELIQLQQILFLKSFGFSLDEIRQRMRMESGKAFSLVLQQQREVLSGQIHALQDAVQLLDKVIAQIQYSGDVGAEQLVAIIEMMKQGNPYAFIMRYFSNGQIKKLIDANHPGQPMAGVVAPDWQRAFEEVVRLHRSGADPRSEQGQRFAADWWAMVLRSTGGDPELLKTMMDMGKDVDSWPGEVTEFKQAVKEFLGTALNEYFTKTNQDMTRGNHE